MNLDTFTALFTGIPFDWLILGGIVVLVALDSLRSGIGRACAIALALPLSLSLFYLLEKTVILKDVAIISSSSTTETITFGLVALLVYLLVRRISLEYIESGTGEPVQALLAGGAATTVFIVVWMQFPSNSVWQLSGNLNTIFAEPYHFIWLMGAYLALAFARG